jgi:hypothetical protein
VFFVQLTTYDFGFMDNSITNLFDRSIVWLRVQNAAQEIRHNRGILNRVRLSWTRSSDWSLHCKRWEAFWATSLILHFILLLTITVFLLCRLNLCCFLNKLQALFYHLTNLTKNSWWNSKNLNDNNQTELRMT